MCSSFICLFFLLSVLVFARSFSLLTLGAPSQSSTMFTCGVPCAPLPYSLLVLVVLLVASLPYSLLVLLVLLVTSLFVPGALSYSFSLFVFGVLDAFGALLPCSLLVLLVFLVALFSNAPTHVKMEVEIQPTCRSEKVQLVGGSLGVVVKV